LKSLTMSGSYLAARHARWERDGQLGGGVLTGRRFHRSDNNELLDRAFISSRGWRIDEAVQLATHSDDRQIQRVARWSSGVPI